MNRIGHKLLEIGDMDKHELKKKISCCIPNPHVHISVRTSLGPRNQLAHQERRKTA